MNYGLLLFGAGSVVGALSESIPTLIVGRGIQGLGAAFVLPATLSIVTNSFERDERGKAIAVWTAVGGMGIGLGPAIGGYLVDRYDWSAAFWIFVPVIALVLIGQSFVPESRDSREVGLDVRRQRRNSLGRLKYARTPAAVGSLSRRQESDGVVDDLLAQGPAVDGRKEN